ncbi:MAG: hypothetical protein R3E95_01575 [Thiolinea sp.]
MRSALGDGYVEALRETWTEIPDSADLVMYWWHTAAEIVREGKTRHFGFITTNSLRQTFNRRVVQATRCTKNPLSLIFAIPDHPWVDSADGADVRRIAMTVGQAGDLPGLLNTVISERPSGNDGKVTLKVTQGKLNVVLSTTANVTAAAAKLQANSQLTNASLFLGGREVLYWKSLKHSK